MRLPWEKITRQDVPGPFEPADLMLAGALCSLPFVPFPVLRAVRRFVCPELSEQRFCQSQVVDGVSADGISLDPAVRRPLRERVRAIYCDASDAAQRSAIDELRTLIDIHGGRLSPLLAIEERMLWEWLNTLDATRLRAACDVHLRDILGTAIFEDRQKIYRWASAAAQRLPIQCFDGELGWILGQLCRTRQIRFPSIALPANAFNDRTMLGALLTAIPDRLLGVYRDGDYLEVGTVTARRHVAIPVADTEPVALEVSTFQPNRSATVWMHQRRAVRIPVGREAVQVKDLRGRTYVLQEFAGNEAPEIVEARNSLAGAMAYRESGELVRFEVLRPGRMGYVVALLDVGCTGFLVDPNMSLRPGEWGLAHVTNVIVEQRRVILRLPLHATAETTAAALRKQQAAQILSPFQARVQKLGKSKTQGRSVHIMLPDEHPLRTATADGKGRVRFPNAAYQTTEGWGPRPGSWVEVVVIADTPARFILQLDLRPFGGPLAITRLRRPGKNDAIWPDVEHLTVGQLLELRVASVADFGVFLQLPDGRGGLLHVSRMFPKRRKGQVPFRPGDLVKVRIDAIDRQQRRISLAQEPVWAPVPRGEMELEVVESVNFGVFLELPDGRHGLLHISEMRPPREPGDIPYRPGDRLRVSVLDDDPVQHRIRFTQDSP